MTTTKRRSMIPTILLLVAVTFNLGVTIGRATAPEPKVKIHTNMITCTETITDEGATIGAKRCERS